MRKSGCRRLSKTLDYFMNSIPNANDWLPVGPESELDDGYAYKNFFGRSLQQAVNQFEENAIFYQEDLMYMPKVPFLFYLQAYIKYLRSEKSVGDSDGASCFLGLIEFKVKEDWNDFDGRFQNYISDINFVADNQEKYDADIDIYGSFTIKRETILKIVAQQKN